MFLDNLPSYGIIDIIAPNTSSSINLPKYQPSIRVSNSKKILNFDCTSPMLRHHTKLKEEKKIK